MTEEGTTEEATPASIAAYLMQRLEAEEQVAQADFVRDVEQRFGAQFVYINENGNPAVDQRVYRVFAKLKKAHPRKVEWDRRGFVWYLDDRDPDDPPIPPRTA